MGGRVLRVILNGKKAAMPQIRNAVEKVRKQEHKTLLRAGDERLSRSKYLWLTNPQNMTDRARAHFADLKAAELKTARAWAIRACGPSKCIM